MIEELRIVQEIFGDLTSVGIWAIVAYFVYKLSIVAAWLCGAWLGYKVVEKIYFSIVSVTDKARDDAETLRQKNISLNVQVAEKTAEVERVKHMYKLLKEAKDAK